jgi:hypothetical protein
MTQNEPSHSPSSLAFREADASMLEVGG